MLRFLAVTVAYVGLIAAVPDVNPNKEAEYSVISWEGWPVESKLNPRVQHIPLDPKDSHLRPPPAHIPDTFDIFVGTSVYRDGYRCGKTLFTALTRATYPNRLHFGILEQIYEGDPTCLDEYCKMAAEEWPEDVECRHKHQILVDTRDAALSAGCTTARHLQQKLVGDQEFCLQVDGHSIFTNRWDEDVLADWSTINNEMAVLTTYPHHIHKNMMKDNGDNAVSDSLPHLCTIVKGGNGLMRITGASMIKGSWMPQLAPLWGGGFSFSKCHAERKVLVDSHTPWLWDGEEFIRSANYWTNGYDLYSPSRLGHVVFHNYSAKPASFWVSPVNPEKKKLDTQMSHNRVRLRAGIPFKGQVDTFEFEKYGFGKVRSFENYLKWANITFEGWMNATNSCNQLHWVPYENATYVEETVGNGWKLRSEDTNDIANAPEIDERVEVARFEAGVGAEDGNAPADSGAKVVPTTATQTEPNAAVINGNDGPVKASLRDGALGLSKKSSGYGVTIFLAALALIALFVTLSSDSVSSAIRRYICVYMKGKTKHRRFE